MSMQPRQPTQIPTETVRVARAAFPKSSLAIRIRDELGPLFSDEAFADLFPSRGKPTWSPGRLALVLVLQFVEGFTDRQAPEGLREVPEVETLRRIWIQQFHQVEGEVVRRGPKERPPGAMRLVTPYDLRARGSLKRDTVWDGYKVHLTQTCEVDAPHLITNMATTVATTPDSVMGERIHDDLAARECLPGEHWVDAGYPTASQVVAAQRDHGVDLQGPVAANTGTHSAAGAGFDQEAFTIDWANERVTCPGGNTTTGWHERRSQQGLPVIRVRFSVWDCRPCPLRGTCLGSSTQERRELRLRHHDEHHALRVARQEQGTDEWKARYKVRAGVEGAISQGVGRCGPRRSRYRGLAKTSLAHQVIGAAINLVRIDAHLARTPRARTRTSHFAALRPAEQVLDGAK